MSKKTRKTARQRNTKEAKLLKDYGNKRKGDTIEYNASIEGILKEKKYI